MGHLVMLWENRRVVEETRVKACLLSGCVWEVPRVGLSVVAGVWQEESE